MRLVHGLQRGLLVPPWRRTRGDRLATLALALAENPQRVGSEGLSLPRLLKLGANDLVENTVAPSSPASTAQTWEIYAPYDGVATVATDATPSTRRTKCDGCRSQFAACFWQTMVPLTLPA